MTRMKSRRDFLGKIPPAAIGLWQLPNLVWTSRSTAGETGAPTGARVWMSYVNVMSGVEEDFRDMKEHGIEGVEVNVCPSIWVGDTIDPAEALRCARKYGLKLAFTLENITLRADRIAAHGITPTPSEMIGGSYEGKGIDWHRFAFTPTKHEILISKPVFGHDWTSGEAEPPEYNSVILPAHRAEVVVKVKDYDGEQHLTIIPATVEADGDFARMRFDLTGARGDLDNVMLAVYWRKRGPLEQPQRFNYFGNTASPHAPGTKQGLRAQIKHELARWSKANGGTFPDDIVRGIRVGDEDYFQTVPNGPANPAQSLPLWDYSDDAIADFKKLNPDDEYPRHWGYPEAFGEKAYADWMWSLHSACAGLLRTSKQTLRDENLGSLKIWRNITRCNSFYCGNDHGGMSLDMAARELDIVCADPYPANDRGYNGGHIPSDMGYVAGVARRHGKALMPWMQGHEGHNPQPEHLELIYEQHLEHEPSWIMYLGYGNLKRPPQGGTVATFPIGNRDSWELSRRLNREFQNRSPQKLKANVVAVRDYQVWSLNGFGGEDCLDRLLAGALSELSARYKVHYDPVETRSLADLDWSELQRYAVVVVALPRTVPPHCWQRFAELPGKCIFFASDCETLAEDEGITGVQSLGEIVTGGEVETAGGPRLASVYTRCAQVEADVEILAAHGDKTCIWKKGSLIFMSSRITHQSISAFLEWIGRRECPELIGQA